MVPETRRERASLSFWALLVLTLQILGYRLRECKLVLIYYKLMRWPSDQSTISLKHSRIHKL